MGWRWLSTERVNKDEKDRECKQREKGVSHSVPRVLGSMTTSLLQGPTCLVASTRLHPPRRRQNENQGDSDRTLTPGPIRLFPGDQSSCDVYGGGGTQDRTSVRSTSSVTDNRGRGCPKRKGEHTVILHTVILYTVLFFKLFTIQSL